MNIPANATCQIGPPTVCPSAGKKHVWVDHDDPLMLRDDLGALGGGQCLHCHLTYIDMAADRRYWFTLDEWNEWTIGQAEAEVKASGGDWG